MTEDERRARNYDRFCTLKNSNTKFHTNSTINVDYLKKDPSPAAEHARRWGKMKPYHLQYKEQINKKET